MRGDVDRGRVISMGDYVRSHDTEPKNEKGEHFDLAHLVGYGRGEIDAAQGRAILEHCRTCRWCGDQLAAILMLMEVKRLRAARKQRIFAAVAATVVLGVALGAGIISGALRSPRRATVDGGATAAQEPEARSDVESLAAEPAAPGTAATADLGRRLATSAAPDRLDLEFMYPQMIPVTATGLIDKRAGLELIVDGRYADAVMRLTNLHEAQPSDAEVVALLGMARYLNGEDDDRVAELLRQGTELRRQDLQHYAAWYLANYYLRQGDVGRAEGVLDELSRWPDSPGRKASDVLAHLRAETR